MAEQLGLLDMNPRSSRKPTVGRRPSDRHQSTGAREGYMATARRRAAGTRLDEHTREVGRRGIADVRRILSQTADADDSAGRAPAQGTAAA